MLSISGGNAIGCSSYRTLSGSAFARRGFVSSVLRKTSSPLTFLWPGLKEWLQDWRWLDILWRSGFWGETPPWALGDPILSLMTLARHMQPCSSHELFSELVSPSWECLTGMPNSGGESLLTASVRLSLSSAPSLALPTGKTRKRTKILPGIPLSFMLLFHLSPSLLLSLKNNNNFKNADIAILKKKKNTEYLLCSSTLMWLNSFNPPNNFMIWVLLLSPFYSPETEA